MPRVALATSTGCSCSTCQTCSPGLVAPGPKGEPLWGGGWGQMGAIAGMGGVRRGYILGRVVYMTVGLWGQRHGWPDRPVDGETL